MAARQDELFMEGRGQVMHLVYTGVKRVAMEEFRKSFGAPRKAQEWSRIASACTLRSERIGIQALNAL